MTELGCKQYFLHVPGLCCASLKDNKVLMKMGLALVLVGHVNFLLGALVQGVVLRHISVEDRIGTLVYAISNVVAIVAGLMGIISGITAIVLSKNKKIRVLKLVLVVFSFLTGLLGLASATGLTVSAIRTMIYKGTKILETHCKTTTSDADSSSITYECPFDPTRLYATIVILWVPLVMMSVVESVFAFRCFAACISFLRRKMISSRVRGKKRDESSAPAEETGAEDEPAEQDDLLGGNTAAERNAWV
ncbi:transmembrane protein 54a [Nematolebias whitei]|uniref:transmembrane protein 54a n=1 Tax=Nematolebias whitei TaxID=451745 RepID=UPI00189AE6B7|nr:transmembrane protein 54a [Nematolebias whitei]